VSASDSGDQVSGTKLGAKLTEEEYDLLGFLEQYYLTNASLPTVEVCDSLGIDAVIYVGALKKDRFRTALLDRGVPERVLPDRPVGGSWKDSALTEEQLLCANVLLDLSDNRSRRKKLTELGITTQKYETWLRDPVFSGYLRKRSEALLGDTQHEAHLALVDRVKSGDLGAVKYYNELTGRYVPASAKAAVGAFDSKMILMRVIEILQIHLSDQPEVLQNVARDLLSLTEPNPVMPVSVERPKVQPPKLNTGGPIVTGKIASVEGAI